LRQRDGACKPRYLDKEIRGLRKRKREELVNQAIGRQGDQGIEIERGACQPGYRETGR
jgi:hypothetical protein